MRPIPGLLVQVEMNLACDLAVTGSGEASSSAVSPAQLSTDRPRRPRECSWPLRQRRNRDRFAHRDRRRVGPPDRRPPDPGLGLVAGGPFLPSLAPLFRSSNARSFIGSRILLAPTSRTRPLHHRRSRKAAVLAPVGGRRPEVLRRPRSTAPPIPRPQLRTPRAPARPIPHLRPGW